MSAATPSRWLKIVLLLLVLAAVAALGWRGISTRQATRQAQLAPA